VLASDAFLQKTTISFDVSLLEIFAPLVIGGRTVLARPGGQQDPEYLVRLIQEQRITYTSFPPSLLYVLLEQYGFDRCDSLRVVITGGETVPAVLPGQFYERLPGASLLNRYGPTETTISVTSWLCERDFTPHILPIGRPTAKARVYLLDADLQPVPVGITGEIFLGGICVARGYLRRPDLTAERFVPDPFGGEAGARLYRTGDLARYRPDGAIEFVGRVDQQVKIRGFRVELGEIEAALARHPAVQEVAVIDREDGPTRSLAAYLVFHAGEAAGEAGLRSFLLESLPAYMVPADFVVLEALPLSPTGKVDRKALPEPRRAAGEVEFEAPQGPVEEILAGIYGDVLGLDRVSRTGDFFELGGHSLLATQVVARVRQALGVDLALRQLFESPTVMGLASQVQSAGLAAPPIVPVPRGEDLPLSFSQERLWFLDQLQPGSPVYNMPAAVRLRGRLDLGALCRGLQAVVDRHESLRTSFAVRGGRAVQVISAELTVRMPVVDLRGLPDSGPLVEALAAEERARPFDLAKGPLLRATLLKLGEEDHAVLLTLHHIITDGWSMGVLVQEIGELYRAFVTGSTPSLPELPIQYADFAVWQRGWMSGEILAAQLGYWRRQLAGLPPLLELPTDRPRPAVQSYRGGRHWTPLSASLSQGLRDLCRAEGATPFMGLLAAFQSLLHLYSRQDDLAVGSPVAGRSRLETEPLIGFFVNNLVLRGDLAGNPGFRRLLAQAREVTLGAYAHQDLPFERLVEDLGGERDLSHAPVFQVALVLQNTPRQTLELPGVTLSRAAAEGGTSKFDLTLNALEMEEGLGLMWSFNRDLFDAATIARMAGHFETLLSGFVADADQNVKDSLILSAEERRQLLAWSTSGTGEPAMLLHELLEAQARRVPDHPAVISPEGDLTYRELNARANGLAHRLRRMGVGPEVRVGLLMDRSPEMVTGLFGILKAGGAYVPFDPAHPEDRIAWVLADAGISLLLTQAHLLDRLPKGSGVEALCLEDSSPAEEAPWSGVTADNLAYVIYTSGSTGRPKGVLVPHRGLGSLSAAQARRFEVTEESRILQFASLSFDASVAEIALAVRVGAALCLPPKSALLPGAELVELLRRWEISQVTLPPSVAATLPSRDFPALRTVVVAGEACAPEVAESWAAGRLFLNAYGPTETTVCATVGAYMPGSGRLSLGAAIPGITVYVVGSELELSPLGVPGELCIGGIGVVRGYSGRPDLTAERFVPDPFSAEPGARLYRSGDLARFRADGTLDFLGRIDQQVKIRGFRIEPGEIESALLRHPAVAEAVVLAREDGRADRRLVAYLVPREEGAAAVDWRSFLAQSLPDYMVPSAVVLLPDLPRTTSGKVDRRALPAPELRGEKFAAPQTPLEVFLADLWKEVLGIEVVGLNDDFFALGGSSITGALFVNQLQEKLAEIVHVVIMFDAPTVARLAAYLREHYREAVARLFGPEEVGGIENAPLQSVGEERVAEMLRVIQPLAPGVRTGPKNPQAVFVLSPPRSGSTLFRVMLAGHPGLFAPPELELLSFNTLAERRAAFGERFSFWLEGAIRAVMEVRGCDAEEAERLLAGFEAEGWSTQDFYRRLQEWIGPRLLVDKTPSYALDLNILERAEETFEDARYIHLPRHPYGMIRSFEEAKLDQVFFRHPHSFSRRELAELIWLVSQRNILRFLERIPPERQLRVRFEDLVTEPAARLEEVCAFLGVEFRPEMAAPYEDKQRRMTDGLHAWSRMLGDVKFHEHKEVDRSVADSWRSHYDRDFLGAVTWELAARLGYDVETERVGSGPLDIEPGEWHEGEPLPLSFSQERLWFFDQMEPGNPVYHIASAFRLAGRLDTAALQASLREIVRRHASLRTTFHARGGSPVQVVSPHAGFHQPAVDLGGLPPERREAEARSLAGELARLPFDLVRGPLLRACLLRLGPEEHVAMLAMHHVVSDGWSMGVLVGELAALYGAFVQGRPSPLPELPIQYPDYALWQRRWLRDQRLESEISFWKEALAGAPVLELPTDRPRPPLQSYRGGQVSSFLADDLIRPLFGLGRAEGATPFMVLLAGMAALLARYSGQEDVSIGSPVANRSRARTEPLIGFFINTLVFRTDLSGGVGFRELLGRVRRTALAAYAHQELPFEKVVEAVSPARALSRSPLFQVMLLVQNAPRQALELPGINLQRMSSGSDVALFDLTLSLIEASGGMIEVLEHSLDLFDPATAERMISHLQILLAGAVADPGRRITELPLLTGMEIRQLAAWSRAEGTSWEDRCLHEMVEARGDLDPDAVAVIGDGETLAYRELEARSNRLARRLRRLGVGPEVRVGLYMERSPQGVVGILGILKAGGVYLPIDPSYPQERRSWILEDAGARVLLTQESLRHDLSAGPCVEVLCLDADWEAIAGESAERPEALARPENLAYTIYTSGSTGTPKGVEVPHGAVAAYTWPAVESYGYGEGERVLQTASWGFDASIEEVLVSLAAGAVVVLWDGDLDPDELLRRSVGLGVTVLTLTPAFLQLWTREVAGKGAPDLPINVVITGGDTLSPEVARLWPSTPLRKARLINDYGPTEAVIVATDWVVPAGEQAETLSIVPIGRPRPGRSAHVVDRHGQPVPVGIPGELLLGGSLARGYLDRPGATAERFVPDPFSGEPGARLYRTGDRARWLPSGELEFLGRIDQQVKIRGFRIELGEIEAALSAHPGVAQAAVLPDRDRERLVAYIVPSGDTPPAGRLRDHLAARLPEYMVPSAFVVLSELPLTSHGKVDRKALSAPDAASLVAAADFVAPRTSTEESLAEIWAGLLPPRPIGAGDDFFHIGGHSLLATQLVSRIREGFGIELPLRRVFERPTLAAMAAEIEAAAGGVGAPPLRAMPRDGDLPLSFAQERLWFLDRLQPGSPAYNMPAAVRLRGDLDAVAFRRSLEEIVRRHESLRTRFAVRGGRPAQVIVDDSRPGLPVVDLRGLPAGLRESVIQRLAVEERRRPFNLSTGPLIRALLLRAEVDEHVVLLTLHHIVADGWSVHVLIREIGALYPALLAREASPLPELPVQYADFALWQRDWLRGEVLESQLAYWQRALAGHSILQLPTDHPRPAVQRFEGAAAPLVLSAEVSRAFLALGRQQGATAYMALLAGFQALLHRYAGQDDVIVGATVAGRDRRELEPLIGFFVNSLPMRTDLSGGPSARELLARVREVALGALGHQDLPFEKLVEELHPERDLSRSPLFQVVFQLHEGGAAPLELPGLVLSPVRAAGQTAKFDIVLNLEESASGALMGTWSYNTDLFDHATLARMSGHFESLLAGAAADPGSSITGLPLLTEAERRQLGLEGNVTSESLEGPCLHEIFAARAVGSPAAIAVSCEGTSMRYGELDRRANRLAWHLIGLGVSPGDLVGLCLERSLDMVVAVLGVLKAGAAYVPLDPAYPRERLAFMLEDSRMPVLLAQESLAEALPEPSPATRVVFLDRIVGESPEAPAVPVSADHPAYVIYTSGSTGRPKGVVVRHGNVARLLAATDHWFGFGPEDVWTLFHSYAFDFSVWEIWGALLYGGRLVVVPYWVSRSPEAFYELLAAERVTVLNQTPSAFRQLIWAERAALGAAMPDLTLRYVIFGGEALEPASLAPWLERHGDEKPRLINMYGITETTVHVTYRPIGWEEVKGSGSIVGWPIPDLGLYVLDTSLQPQPVGVPGEIHVGGAGLALGYLGRPELTAERFVPNPYGEPGSRLYRSGDLARFLANRDLEYLGRIDHQVKIRGFRIELGEIESALAAQPSVREAVVLAREDGAEKRLVAYVVPDEEAPTLPELREALAANLPDYMLPSALVALDRLPLTANGKVDRRALPAPDSTRADLGGSYAAPATDLERFLSRLWQEVLSLPRVGVLDNFFELGGSSITGAVLVSRLQETLREIVHVVVIFDAPTIAEMSAYLIEQHPEAVARLFGRGTVGGSWRDGAADEAGECELAELRALVRPLPPPGRALRGKNPPAVFVLSPPRSGSTLLRVMLGGHPRLFAPPELELLSFNTLRERRAAFAGRDAFWLEGVIRAVMEIRGCSAAEAEALVEEHEREDLTTLEFYGRVQEWLSGRILVDKTPSYALDPAILRRAEEGFAEPFYIHLIRHPLGMIHSFEEAKLDQIFFRRDHPFSRRQLAELIWRASHENIVEFLDGVPAGRQHWVRFEDLLREPEGTLRGICERLGLDYHPDMAEPYERKSARMTDGVYAESRMLGDVKFHQHAGVEAGVAERWRERHTLDSLGDGTRELATRLGYEAGGPVSPIPAALVGLQPEGSKPPLFLVHPLSGELFLYRRLVAALGPDQPVYGFQAVGFTTDDEPLETVEEMAGVYRHALLSLQPRGPYLLAGSSLGGLIAFEMARQLRSQGMEVAFLGLLDSPDPALFAREEEDGDAEAEAVILSYLSQGIPPFSRDHLRGLAPEERLALLLQVGRERGALAPAFGVRELGRLVRVVGANRRALRAYAPQPCRANLVYLKAATSEGDDAAVWSGLALGGAEIQEIPGGHLSMHFPPHVEELAARLGSCMERALGETVEERDREV
jgi:amino acid adenylation domain-containing protein